MESTEQRTKLVEENSCEMMLNSFGYLLATSLAPSARARTKQEIIPTATIHDTC